jgi:hypothetical protein
MLRVPLARLFGTFRPMLLILHAPLAAALHARSLAVWVRLSSPLYSHLVCRLLPSICPEQYVAPVAPLTTNYTPLSHRSSDTSMLRDDTTP